MYLSFKAISISLIIFFLLDIGFSQMIVRKISDPTNQALYISLFTSILIFVCGAITGYIAKNKCLVHGLLLGSLIVLIPLLVFLIIMSYWYLVLHAKWTGGPTQDTLNNFVIPGIFTLLITCIIAISGAKIGEILSKYYCAGRL